MARRLYLGLEGYLFEGAERWATGCAYTVGGATPTATELQSWATAIEGLFSAHSSDSWVDEMSANGGITRVVTRYYGSTGGAVFAGSQPVSPIVAGQGTPTMPAQCSRVYSLLSGISGRSYRGRMYLPCLNAPVSAAGKSQPQLNQAAEFADFLIDVAAAWPGADPIRPGVHSATQNLVTDVTAVRVGDVIDTQRRRRDALVENYQEAQIP